jgi:hypothetical protein
MGEVKKMRKLIVLVGALILVFGMTGFASAALTNGGFESGDFTGWTVITPPGAVSAVVTGALGQTPIEGTYFGGITSDGPGSYSVLKQTVLMDAGDTLSGYVSVYDGEYNAPCCANDIVKLEITASAGYVFATPFSFQSVDNTTGSLIDWTYWEYTAGWYGNVVLKLSVTNGGDDLYETAALLDGVTHSVPEPATLLLIGSGLFGLALLRRRK